MNVTKGESTKTKLRLIHQIISVLCDSSENILLVTLLSFDAYYLRKNAVLQWKTL